MSIWDIPLGTANVIYAAAYVALIVGAIVTAIATISLFYASGIRDRYASTDIEQAKSVAASAMASASKQEGENLALKAKAAKMEIAAEEARQQTALLQASTAKALADVEAGRHKLAEVEARTTYRVLSGEQSNEITAVFKSIKPGEIWVFDSGDDESIAFANAIGRSIQYAFWTVNRGTAGLNRGLQSPPLSCNFSRSPECEELKSTFARIGLKLEDFGFRSQPSPSIIVGRLQDNRRTFP